MKGQRLEVLVLDGPTGSGKSVLLNHVRTTKSERFHAIRKLSTREQRGAFDEDHYFVSSIPDSNRYLRYHDVGAKYAIDLDEIEILHTRRLIPALICTHTKTIEELKDRFCTKSVFIYRPMSEQEISALMTLRGVTSPSRIKERLSELADLAGRYTERILLYDHVVLNIGTKKDMFSQLDVILLSEEKE